ncbi:helix-turn-helix domain-containing protein [Streptomyces mobaraensis]|uniref:helix-turn-helix domain-containing protein n=1 Tax=Streptomyces mobaraensis TaxID=35621 RepID=UPI0013DF27BE|nr:helix-turn-helix transcriptional regulator [Streptomyces mobaraensis]
MAEGARQLLRTVNSVEPEEALLQALQTKTCLDSLIAGLVARERHTGATWTRISGMMEINVDTARHRYSEARILRSLRHHVHLKAGQSLSSLFGSPADDPLEPPLPRHATASPAYNRLAPVLSMLVRNSRKTQQQVSHQAGCSPSYLSRILTGERIPMWPLAERLAQVCEADPAVLRDLWEAEKLRDKRPAPPPAADTPLEELPAGKRQVLGTTRLMTALHTQHVRAGQPSDVDIAVASQWRLTPGKVRTLLEGNAFPAWNDLEALLHVLGGHVEHFRRLWETTVDVEECPSPTPGRRDPVLAPLSPSRLLTAVPTLPPPANGTPSPPPVDPRTLGWHLAIGRPAPAEEELLQTLDRADEQLGRLRKVMEPAADRLKGSLTRLVRTHEQVTWVTSRVKERALHAEDGTELLEEARADLAHLSTAVTKHNALRTRAEFTTFQTLSTTCLSNLSTARSLAHRLLPSQNRARHCTRT